MFMTISRNSTGVNGLKHLLNKPLMPQEFHVPVSRGYGKRKHSQSFFFVKRFFSKPRCLKSQNTIPD